MSVQSLAEKFRTCPTTGFKVFLPGEKLIMFNAVTAIVFLLVGGILALLLVLTRFQAVHLLPEDLFYRFLTLHGIAMLVAWIVFFEMAILYFTSSVMLNCRLAAPWAAWLQYALMFVGAAMVTVEILLGNADVMFTSYVPLKANHLYYLGIILFAVGAIVGCIVFFATLVVAKHEKTYEGSLPLVVYGAMAAAMIAILTLAHGATVFIPTWLWALDIIPMIDAEAYRLIFWGFGHSTQQINLCAMIACWYLLGALTVGAKPPAEKLCRSAFLLYVFFILIASEHHLLVDPGLGTAHKVWNTGYFMHLAILGSLIHAFAVPASVEIALRKQGYTKGLFEWLKKAPWANPGWSSLVIAVVGFGFLGGISGVVYGTEQLNMITHNTLKVPGHFHATVVVGTTLTFMGITYYVLPLIFKREVAFPTIAKYQPYVYGLSSYVFVTAMMFLGGFGVPRRSWDMTTADALFQTDFGPVAEMGTAVMGIAGTFSVIGGAMFILVAVGTLLIGKKIKA